MGGGSGGHITPIVAVINKLVDSEDGVTKSLPPAGRADDRRSSGEGAKSTYDIRVWCDKKFAPQARELLGDRVRVDVIAAGKLRRYANLNFWYKWFSPWHIIHTHIPNLIDLFKIAGGFIQSLVKMLIWRPDVVFCKGGYVSLPVGIVAHLYRIPLVIHDSDTVPGLTNRVLAKYATAIGTGAPVENYPNYPRRITKFIGIPVRADVKPVTAAMKVKIRQRLGLDPDRPLIVAMGGGLGAVAINEAMATNVSKLVKAGTEVVMLIGRGRTVDLPSSAAVKKHVHVYEFSDQIVEYEQAADVVVTRAGATTMAELATVGAATIIIPSPYLAGDHQTKNAEVYQRAGAAVVLNEFDLRERPAELGRAIEDLLSHPVKRQKLAENLHTFAKPGALDGMVQMILEAGKSTK